jgi:predicted secreted protein
MTGVVKVGSGTVAEVKSFSVDQNAATVEDTAMGDTWTTHLVTQKSWSASIACMWDDTDSDGQVALAVGTSVSLELYPEGTTTGDYKLSGTALITSVSTKQTHDGLVEADFTCQGSGALAIGTAT